MESMGQERVTARKGFFPLVLGDDVRLRQGGAAVIGAKRDMRLSQSGGQWLVALRDQTVRYSGGAVLVSRNVRMTNGFAGIVVGGTVTLEGRARALLTGSPAVVVAAAAAFALGWIAGMRRSRR